MSALKRLATKLETIATSSAVLSSREKIRLMLIAAQHAAAGNRQTEPGEQT